jgi:hypothetical protein
MEKCQKGGWRPFVREMMGIRVRFEVVGCSSEPVQSDGRGLLL